MQRGPELLTYNYTWQAYGGVNQTLAKNSNTLLPSFLTFSQYVIPVGTGKDGNVTNMRYEHMILHHYRHTCLPVPALSCPDFRARHGRVPCLYAL